MWGPSRAASVTFESQLGISQGHGALLSYKHTWSSAGCVRVCARARVSVYVNVCVCMCVYVCVVVCRNVEVLHIVIVHSGFFAGMASTARLSPGKGSDYLKKCNQMFGVRVRLLPLDEWEYVNILSALDMADKTHMRCKAPPSLCQLPACVRLE